MMKKYARNFGLLILFAVMLGASSCEKASEVLALPSMKATVDGVAWTSIFRYSTLSQSKNVIVITGTPEATQDVDKAIILTINGTDTGTYTLNAGTLSTQCLVVYKKTASAVENGSDYFTSTQATIQITKIDKTKQQVSGTFSATLYAVGVANPVVISNGTFENLNYQLSN